MLGPHIVHCTLQDVSSSTIVAILFMGLTTLLLDWIWGLLHNREFTPSTVNMSKTMVRDVTGSRGEHFDVLLINDHVAELPSKYLQSQVWAVPALIREAFSCTGWLMQRCITVQSAENKCLSVQLQVGHLYPSCLPKLRKYLRRGCKRIKSRMVSGILLWNHVLWAWCAVTHIDLEQLWLTKQDLHTSKPIVPRNLAPKGLIALLSLFLSLYLFWWGLLQHTSTIMLPKFHETAKYRAFNRELLTLWELIGCG